MNNLICGPKFEGVASAEGPPAGSQVRIWGEGNLNGHPASFEVKSDSLASASHQRPYHFSYTERSSGSHLEGEGVLSRPFDFNALESTFQAGGEDKRGPLAQLLQRDPSIPAGRVEARHSTVLADASAA